MNWRDLLYFSKGERRALALLLCLITISWILLLWTNTKRMPIEAQISGVLSLMVLVR